MADCGGTSLKFRELRVAHGISEQRLEFKYESQRYLLSPAFGLDILTQTNSVGASIELKTVVFSTEEHSKFNQNVSIESILLKSVLIGTNHSIDLIQSIEIPNITKIDVTIYYDDAIEFDSTVTVGNVSKHVVVIMYDTADIESLTQSVSINNISKENIDV